MTLLVSGERKVQFNGAKRGSVYRNYSCMHIRLFVTLHHTPVYTHANDFPNKLTLYYMHSLYFSACLLQYINSFILNTCTNILLSAS